MDNYTLSTMLIGSSVNITMGSHQQNHIPLGNLGILEDMLTKSLRFEEGITSP